jgi:hypothetical protein
VKTFFAAQTTKKIASKVCRMPRSSDRLARSLSAFEYLSSTRPAAAVFSNNFSSQAKWFHPSSSRPLHCCLPTLHCHCDSKCQIKYCSLPQHNRYRSRGRRLVFARAQVNKCTCTLAQHSRDQWHQSARALHRAEPVNGLVTLLCHLFPITLYCPSIISTSLAFNEKFACALCACVCVTINCVCFWNEAHLDNILSITTVVKYKHSSELTSNKSKSWFQAAHVRKV